MQPKNFCSTLEANSTLSPHEVYTMLAIDAALLAVNDQIPALGDDGNNTVLNAAQAAAEAVLKLCAVPNDWLAFMEAMRADYRQQVRQELWEVIFDQLPHDSARMCSDEKIAALEKLRRMVGEGRKKMLCDAVGDLDQAYMSHLLYEVEEAFALGFAVATNPAKLLLEKGCG